MTEGGKRSKGRAGSSTLSEASRIENGRSGAAARLRSLAVLGLIAASVTTARASLADHYVVPSGSMRPTLIEGDRIVVYKVAFGLRIPFTTRWLITTEGPARGDVVVLRSPENGDTLVKRVVGLPGETVAVVDGVAFVDGRPVDLMAVPAPQSGQLDYGPQILGPEEYLVLGDNRPNSRDGRVFGPVRVDEIYGRVEGVVWREGHFTWVEL